MLARIRSLDKERLRDLPLESLKEERNRQIVLEKMFLIVDPKSSGKRALDDVCTFISNISHGKLPQRSEAMSSLHEGSYEMLQVLLGFQALLPLYDVARTCETMKDFRRGKTKSWKDAHMHYEKEELNLRKRLSPPNGDWSPISELKLSSSVSL